MALRFPPLSLLLKVRLTFLLVLALLCTTQAMTVQRVAVIGATGRLGRLAVQQLVAQGIPCNILVRQVPQKEVIVPSQLDDGEDYSSEQVTAYLTALHGVQAIQGDVGNVESLQTLVKDCDACLALFGATRKSKISDLWNSNVADTDPSHAKQVNYQGVVNLLQACRDSKCRRIVRITGKGENPTSFISILINTLGSMAKAWNYQGEQVLRGQTDVAYTIIRPGIMVNEPSVATVTGNDPPVGLALADDGGDLPVSKISYADVASLCIECLNRDNTARSTLCAMTTAPSESEHVATASSWGALLAKVREDRRAFPNDMLQQHFAAVRKFLLGTGAVAFATLAFLLKLVF